MNYLEKLKAIAQSKANVTGGSLFKDENVNGGTFNKEAFLDQIAKAIEADKGLYTHLVNAFNYMILKRKVSNEIQVIHENGQAAIWLNFRFGNTNKNVKVPAVDGMLELLTDYAHRGRIVSVSFEDLIKRAAGEV
jgi:hypothetical protein